MLIVAACGPLMNLLLAVVFGLILRVAICHRAYGLDVSRRSDGLHASGGMFVC